MLKKLMATVAVVGVMAILPGVAQANEYLFGFSGFVNATLDIQLSSGSLTAIASSQGWWSDTATNGNDNSNYITGSYFGTNWNNYFTFDFTLPDSETILSASLKIAREVGYSEAGAENLTYSLFDVSTSPADLANKVNGPDAAIYSDLGSGVSYGSYVVSVAGDTSEILSFSLNGAALSALGSGRGSFSIGGTLTPGTTAEVPEPGTLALLAAFGVPASLAIRRRLSK